MGICVREREREMRMCEVCERCMYVRCVKCVREGCVCVRQVYVCEVCV